MKLFMKENIFSGMFRFKIKNENGQELYDINNTVFSMSRKTTIIDYQNNKVAFIERIPFNLLSKHNIYFNDTLYCEMKREFNLFEKNYTLSNGYHVKGDFLMTNYSISDNNNIQIANIRRGLFNVGDKYEIDIIDMNKLNIILAILAVIANDINDHQRRD